VWGASLMFDYCPRRFCAMPQAHRATCNELLQPTHRQQSDTDCYVSRKSHPVACLHLS
jgi:hypothetical protein